MRNNKIDYMAAEKIKLLLADDHPVVLKGLKEALTITGEFEVMVEALNGREVLNQVSCDIDVYILDINMPILNGADCARNIIKKSKLAKVLFYSVSSTKDEIFYLYHIGGKGFVSKTRPISKLIEAIQIVHSNKIYYDDFFLESEYKNYQNSYNRELKVIQKLTNREREVVHLISIGFSNQHICNKLNISKRTVEDHKLNIKKKIKLTDTQELLMFAIKHKNEFL